MKKVLCFVFSAVLLLCITACGSENVVLSEVPEDIIKTDVQEYLSAFVGADTTLISIDQTQSSINETQRQVVCVVEDAGVFTMTYTAEAGSWFLENMSVQLDGDDEVETPLPEEPDMSEEKVEEKKETVEPLVQFLMDGCWYLYDEANDIYYEYIFRSDYVVEEVARFADGTYSQDRYEIAYTIDKGKERFLVSGTPWIIDQEQKTLWRIAQGSDAEMVDRYLLHYWEAPGKDQMKRIAEKHYSTGMVVEQMKGQDGYCLYENSTIGLTCYYPDGFNGCPPQREDCLRRYEKPKTGEIIEICYVELDYSLPAKEALKMLSANGDDLEITYSANGEHWYAVSARGTDGYYYRKALFRNNDTEIAWFEYFTPKLETPGKNDAIEYMEDNFDLQ